MKRITLSTLIIITSIFLSGCASQNALNQPEKKDLTILQVGTHRDMVILELGAPANTKTDENVIIDLFSFVQGYSQGNRAARAFSHGVADIATLGLWSLAGSQIEESFNGTIMGYRVTYEDELVTKTERLVEKDVD
jgi:hypothetical protein